MNTSSINSITDNYRERIQRLALFDPLFKLENKKGKDKSGREIDYFGLGLLTLLFFFENMLLRKKRAGIKELTTFFLEINQGKIDLDYEGFEKVARSIIEVFRPPSGKRNVRSFYNWEHRRDEVVQYSILKADISDIESNTQYYALDEQGLELLFATKEYFSEFQLSINQLLLRKQLEKGEFVGALRQIDEMRLDVKTLQDRIIKIKHEIQRNIISDETYERYKKIIEDVNLRLTRENEEFEELQSFVRETRTRFENNNNTEEEYKTSELIISIDRELGDVHFNHRELLQESIILKTSAIEAARESLYYVGIDSFNFKQEIAVKVVSSPLPLYSSRTLIEPFLHLERKETWSPLSVFANQKIGLDEKNVNTREFMDISTEEQVKMETEIQRDNFRNVMKIILEIMGDKAEITLKEVVSNIENSEYEAYLSHRSFYDFWILLHHYSPIAVKISEEDEAEGKHLFDKVVELLDERAEMVSATELNEIVRVTERYSIKNMLLRLEDIK